VFRRAIIRVKNWIICLYQESESLEFSFYSSSELVDDEDDDEEEDVAAFNPYNNESIVVVANECSSDIDYTSTISWSLLSEWPSFVSSTYGPKSSSSFRFTYFRIWSTISSFICILLYIYIIIY